MKVRTGCNSLVGLTVVILITSFTVMVHLKQNRDLWMKKTQTKAQVTSINKELPTLSSAAVSMAESPVVYTFFDDLDNVYDQRRGGKTTSSEDHEILDAWTYSWKSMGFNPKVLTLNDAKRHPDYERFSNLLDEKVALGSNTAHDKVCYLRWLAVAASGGGILTDYDTIPLRPPQPDDFIMPKKFTFYQSYVPSFMKGTPQQWANVANIILDEAVQPERRDMSIYSDMMALSDASTNPRLQGEIIEHRPRRIMDAKDLLEKDSDQYPMRECHRLYRLRAVHFHQISGTIKSPIVDNLLEKPIYKSQRATLMAKWITYWPTFFKDHCHGLNF